MFMDEREYFEYSFIPNTVTTNTSITNHEKLKSRNTYEEDGDYNRDDYLRRHHQNHYHIRYSSFVHFQNWCHLKRAVEATNVLVV